MVVTAIYENGVLRPLTPLALPERTEVQISIYQSAPTNTLEEFVLVEQILAQRLRTLQNKSKLEQMEQAANDPLFLADMHEIMEAFTAA